MGLFDFLKRQPAEPAGPDRVTFDDEGVTRWKPDGTTQTVRWDDLVEVTVATSDAGPWQDDVLWILAARDGVEGCMVPSEAEGMDLLLGRLQQLPGFDNEAVIRAMGSTDLAFFTCWRRPE
ncbi:MAG TPA: hypothetical protein VFR81_02185 [Longimicrobium sp.]|nr:hypothetical protein [Longimicrobium sp.]